MPSRARERPAERAPRRPPPAPRRAFLGGLQCRDTHRALRLPLHVGAARLDVAAAAAPYVQHLAVHGREAAGAVAGAQRAVAHVLVLGRVQVLPGVAEPVAAGRQSLLTGTLTLLATIDFLPGHFHSFVRPLPERMWRSPPG